MDQKFNAQKPMNNKGFMKKNKGDKKQNLPEYNINLFQKFQQNGGYNNISDNNYDANKYNPIEDILKLNKKPADKPQQLIKQPQKSVDNPLNNVDTSFFMLVKQCPLYEINNKSYPSKLIKTVAQRLLTDQLINEVLIRAQDENSLKKLAKVFLTLRVRLVGISTIYHKCYTRMKYGFNGGDNEDQTLKRCVEVIFIKNPTNQERSMKGFKEPLVKGVIMNYNQYLQTYNFKKDIKEEAKEEKEEEQRIASVIYMMSYLKSNLKEDEQDSYIFQQQQQNQEEDKCNSYKVEEHDTEDDYDVELEIAKQLNPPSMQNFSEADLYGYIEQKSRSLNPHLKNFSQENLNFTCKYMLTQNTVNTLLEKDQQMEQESREVMSNTLLKIANIKKPKNLFFPIEKSVEQDIVKAALYQFYKKQGHRIYITNRNIESNSSSNIYQTQLILTGQTDNLKFLSVRIDDKSYNEEELASESNLKIIKSFLAAASNHFGVDKKQITILGISQDNGLIFDFQVKEFESYQNFNNNGKQQFQAAFPNAQIFFTVKSLIDGYQISDQYFSSKFNIFWDDSHLDYEATYRGSLPRKGQGLFPQRYFYPIGFQGYGINVQQWMQEDKDWFGQDEDSKVWTVLYHGTVNQKLKFNSHPIQQSIQSELYLHNICRLTGERLQSEDSTYSYFSDHIYAASTLNDQSPFVISLGEKTFQLVFQCRVNPLIVMSPDSDEHLYMIESKYSEMNVRPYRVCLKEI